MKKGIFKTNAGCDAYIVKVYSVAHRWFYAGYVKLQEENCVMIAKWDNFGVCITHEGLDIIL